jgi:hypothetical protein
MALAEAGLLCRAEHHTHLGPPHPSFQQENARRKRHILSMFFYEALLLFTTQRRWRAATQT